jgi:hypothetical protein
MRIKAELKTPAGARRQQDLKEREQRHASEPDGEGLASRSVWNRSQVATSRSSDARFSRTW